MQNEKNKSLVSDQSINRVCALICT